MDHDCGWFEAYFLSRRRAVRLQLARELLILLLRLGQRPPLLLHVLVHSLVHALACPFPLFHLFALVVLRL